MNGLLESVAYWLAEAYKKTVVPVYRKHPSVVKNPKEKVNVYFKLRCSNMTILYKDLFKDKINKEFHKDYLVVDQNGYGRDIWLNDVLGAMSIRYINRKR